MERASGKKKKPLTEREKARLLKQYEASLQKKGGLAAGIEKVRAENKDMEDILRKNPNRLMGGCG